MALGFALFHYPLAFWTLLGMETGLVLALSALAMAVAFAGEGRSKASAALVLLLGLACLARPDAVIVAAIVLVYRRLTAGARSAAWREAAGVAVVVAAHAAFRLAYYGAIVPNTYRLKVGGVPLGFRLVNGLAYVSPWVVAGLPLIVLAAGSLWGGERRRRGLLLAAAASLLAYQVWIGGDINDLRSVLKPDATIAVFWAGTVPYYAPFRAFDLLGKSDARTAGLPPDLSGAVSWSRMRSVPGHNKYDLRYAVLRLRPTFLEHDAWGRDDVSAYVRQNYVELRTPYGRLLLLKASPSVRWEMLPRLAARR